MFLHYLNPLFLCFSCSVVNKKVIVLALSLINSPLRTSFGFVLPLLCLASKTKTTTDTVSRNNRRQTSVEGTAISRLTQSMPCRVPAVVGGSWDGVGKRREMLEDSRVPGSWTRRE